MKRLIAVSAIIFYSLIFTAGIDAHHKPNSLHNIRHAINLNWCGNTNKYCESGRQAWNVASCETGRTFDVYASNGQYRGIFQMGASERKRFGHGNNAWEQSKAAHRYYVVARGWGPWSCRWAAS